MIRRRRPRHPCRAPRGGSTRLGFVIYRTFLPSCGTKLEFPPNDNVSGNNQWGSLNVCLPACPCVSNGPFFFCCLLRSWPKISRWRSVTHFYTNLSLQIARGAHSAMYNFSRQNWQKWQKNRPYFYPSFNLFRFSRILFYLPLFILFPPTLSHSSLFSE